MHLTIVITFSFSAAIGITHSSANLRQIVQGSLKIKSKLFLDDIESR